MNTDKNTKTIDRSTLFDLLSKSAYVMAKTLDERYANKDWPTITPVIHQYQLS